MSTAPPAVTYDADASTSTHAIYRVPSGTRGRIYRVINALSPERYEKPWDCQCEASLYHRPCWHIAAAQEYATRRWWARWWATCSDAVLADATRTYGLQTIEGTLSDEGAIALDELRRFLAEREAVGA